MQRVAQGDDVVRCAEVAPGVSSRTADRNLKTAATKGFGNDCVSARAVDDDAPDDGVLPFRFGKNVAHAAQIAFSFFADISDEEERSGMRKLEFLDGRGNGEQGRHARSVVRNTRTVKLSPFVADIQGGTRGENGVDVRADRNDFRTRAWNQADYVADRINADARKSHFAESSREPLGSRSLSEGRSRNHRKVQLPTSYLRLVRAEPFRRRGHARQSGKVDDFLRPGRTNTGRGACNRAHGINS